MKKKTKKSFRHPNRFLFGLAKAISRFMCRFILNAKVVRNELEGKTGRCVIIANHESVIDVLPAYTVVPAKTHFVVSKAMMQSMPIAPLMEMCGAIDKNQFQTSALDMRRMKAVLDHDEPLMLYPAGLMTESGASTPIPLATAKVLKWFKADIYVARVNGTYYFFVNDQLFATETNLRGLTGENVVGGCLVFNMGIRVQNYNVISGEADVMAKIQSLGVN